VLAGGLFFNELDDFSRIQARVAWVGLRVPLPRFLKPVAARLAAA
jgi:hypothetical protein